MKKFSYYLKFEFIKFKIIYYHLRLNKMLNLNLNQYIVQSAFFLNIPLFTLKLNLFILN